MINVELAQFKNIGANFIIVCLLNVMGGFLSYGLLPFLFSLINFTNNAKTQKKIFSLIDKKPNTLGRKVSLIDEQEEDEDK
jgi:hypothetical protein